MMTQGYKRLGVGAMMENGEGGRSQAPQNAVFEIELAGYLPDYRSAWFDGMAIMHDGAGQTVLRGPIVDQAALHGLLERVRDLGIALLSLRRVDPPPPEGTT